MARAKYYIKRQMEGKEIDEVANFTRKDKAERFLNKLFRGLKEAERHYPYWVRQGYFKSEFVGLCVNFKTEYWIEIAQKVGLISEDIAKTILHDCGSIRRILISSINTAKENNK